MASNIVDSVLRYKGVDLPYIKTDSFKQEGVFSADGCDLLYTHITIEISGILNSCFLNGVDPACWIEQNRPILLQRGGQLYFYTGGIQIIPPPFGGNTLDRAPTTGHELVASPVYQNPASSTCNQSPNDPQPTTDNFPLDAKLGPKPIRFDVVQIRGGTFAFRYVIETWVPYCSGGGPAATILSNRWESVLDIDKDYFYTRTISGTLILNGQYLTNSSAPAILASTTNGIPNSLLIFPPLFKNWKREVIRFTLSSDQLTLTYSIQDRQQYLAIPRPAVRIDATYTEITPAGNAQASSGIGFANQNMMQVNMDIAIIGDPNTQYPDSYPTLDGTGAYNPDVLKFTLLKIMFQLLFSRIQFPFLTESPFGKDKPLQNGTFITHFELRENVMKPEVGCRVMGLKTRTKVTNIYGSAATWTGTVFDATMVAQPVYLDDMIAQVATQPISIGNWASYLLMCSVVPRDPCYGGATPGSSSQSAAMGTVVYTSQVSTTQTAIGTTYTEKNNLDFSNANYTYPFTEYTAFVDYPTDNHILQLPIMYDVEKGTTSGTTAASSAFCQTASPTSQKVVHWKAKRLGAWPKAPKPSAVDFYGDSSPTDKVLRYTPQFSEVEVQHDGITRHYTIAGVYEIGMARRVQWDVPGTVLSTICSQVIGSSTYGDADSSFPTNNFVDGILNSGTSPGAN